MQNRILWDKQVTSIWLPTPFPPIRQQPNSFSLFKPEKWPHNGHDERKQNKRFALTALFRQWFPR